MAGVRAASCASALALMLGLSSPCVRADGVITNLKAYEYRADGKPWRCTVTDAMTGSKKGVIYYAGDGAIEKVERFDAEGNKVETAYYDLRRKLRAGPDGWAAIRWWYHEGVLRLQISYDEHGKPMERLFFSESGKLIGRYYRKDDGVNPYVNAAMYKMLGANNVAYYDPKESYTEASRLTAD